jgi:uncharacterized protein
MLSRLMPREDQFFKLFKNQGELIVEGAEILKELFADIANAEKYTRRLKEVEHRADEITHRTLELLHQTFITPMDREDIHQLASKMDDVLDFMDAVAQRVLLYDVRITPPNAPELAEICRKSAIAIQSAVSQLENMKNSAAILKICVEINRLENEADHAFRSATGKLFREEPDTRQLIKFKEIYEMLEETTDRCEDVANIIEGIVLEYS